MDKDKAVVKTGDNDVKVTANVSPSATQKLSQNPMALFDTRVDGTADHGGKLDQNIKPTVEYKPISVCSIL